MLKVALYALAAYAGFEVVLIGAVLVTAYIRASWTPIDDECLPPVD